MDLNRRPVEEAQVFLVEGASYPDIAAITGADGRFSLGSLPPGPYTVMAEKDGYDPVTIAFIVSAGRPVVLEFILSSVSVEPSPTNDARRARPESPFEAPEIYDD